MDTKADYNFSRI